MKLLPKLALIACLPLLGCSRPAGTSFLQALGITERDVADVPNYPEKLNDENFWSYFTGVSSDVSYTGYIKFTLELDDQGQIKTLIWHPSTFSYHADYLTTLPAYTGLSPDQIDAISLHEKGRRLILGTALSVKDEFYSNLEWDYQIVSEDPLAPALVASTMNTVIAHLPRATPEKSFYLPAPQQVAYTNSQVESFAAAGVKLAKRQITENRVCYASGWGIGYVKKLNEAQLDKAIEEGSIQPDEILVLEKVPEELPQVAGIVIASPSSPNSHPALLAQMLGVPFFYEKDAMSSETWTKYAASREPVYINSKAIPNQGCDVLIRDGNSLQAEDVAKLSALKKPQPLKLSTFDSLLGSAPVALKDYGMNDGSRIGAKAANVAELARIIPDNTIQEGLALPLAAYALFLNSAKTSKGTDLRPEFDKIIGKLNQPELPLSDTIPLLEDLRDLIEKAKVSPEQSEEILKSIETAYPKGTRIKLRSSSNVEDLPEFNGAGLYESKGACVGDDRLAKDEKGLCETKQDTVLKAIKGVWASLYTMKAWVARRTFSVNEVNVGMGVLIQRSYQGELANGVALVQYPEGTFFGNDGVVPDIEVLSTGFPGEDDAVTNPPPGKIPETIRLRKDYVEVVVASSEVPRGQKLLSDAANASLLALGETIYRHYEKVKNPTDRRNFVLDLEWKLILVDGQERVIVKQVRPVPSPDLSTAGLGFGSFVIGEKTALLCPTIQENTDGMAKLLLSFPMQVSVDMHELPLGDVKAVKTPIKSLSIEGQTIDLGTESQLKAEDWMEEWGTSRVSRFVSVNSSINYKKQSYNLSWNVKQTRTVNEPNRLLDSVQSLWTMDFTLSQGDKTQSYVLVVGQDSCDSDAYQGLTPGSFQASQSYVQNRKPPRAYNAVYGSVTAKPLNVSIEARTSFQGFDKTLFLGIDRVTIKGLLERELVLGAGSAVYAPGHHNFQWTYAFDMDAVSGLTDAEKGLLREMGIRYLVIENPGEHFGEPDMIIDQPIDTPVLNVPEPEPAPETPVVEPEPERTFKVYGVDEAGKRTEIDVVRLVSGTNPFAIFD